MLLAVVDAAVETAGDADLGAGAAMAGAPVVASMTMLAITSAM